MADPLPTSTEHSRRHNFTMPTSPAVSVSVPSFRCSHCGHSPVNLIYNNETSQSMLAHQACFTCNFWLDKINQYNNPHYVVINNNMYHIGGWASPGNMRGFGGRIFHIKRHDSDQIITTNNLWHNGEIPERFRQVLTNNADFVNPLPADDSLVVCEDGS